jgi:N-acetylated-alpha-linked acidic dipeptidase
MRAMLIGLLLATTATTAMAATPAQEAAFDNNVSSADQMGWLKLMSSAPNHIGAAHNKANAEWLLKQYQSFGWQAKIEEFHAPPPSDIGMPTIFCMCRLDVSTKSSSCW